VPNQVQSLASSLSFTPLTAESWANCRHQDAVAELMIDAAAEYYQSIPMPVSQLTQLVQSQVSAPGTELESVSVLCDGEDIVGAVAVCPLLELDRRRQAGLAPVLRKLSAADRALALRRIKGHAEQIAPAQGDGWYLARFAVSPGLRRRGIGTILLQFVLRRIGNEKPIYLHVAERNLAAVNLYSKEGFRRLSDGTHAFGFYARWAV